MLKLPSFVFAFPAALVLELLSVCYGNLQDRFSMCFSFPVAWSVFIGSGVGSGREEGEGGLLKIRSEDFPFSIACSQKVVSLAKREESGGYRIGKEVDLPLLAFH